MDNKNNSNNPIVDMLGFIDQALDVYIEKQLVEACEKTGDQTAIGVVNLCIEYGIRGKKLMEFIQKLGMICDLTKGKKKEEETDDQN